MFQIRFPVFIFWLICKIFIVFSQQYTPRASLFTSPNGSGNFLTLPTQQSIPQLTTYNFNNQAFSVCLVGTWLFYEDEYFNGNGNAGMEYVFEPIENCINFNELKGQISSVRLVGSIFDYRSDSITFYSDKYFQGDEQFVVSDVERLRLIGRIASFITTGSSPWTIYDKPFYQGNSICLQIEFRNSTESQFHQIDYTPVFITDTTSIKPNVPHGSIASIKKGCTSKTISALKKRQLAAKSS